MNCAESKELLVAYVEGLLEDSEKQAVAEHLKGCSSCQAELKELTGLHDRLVTNGKALAQSDLETDVMNQVVREQNVRLKAADRAAAGLKLRRIIMKSSITKMAAAAVIIIAVLIGLNPFGGTVTFAQVVEPILNARTMVFDFFVGDEETSPAMHETIVGQLVRRTISNIPGMTMIIDLENAQMLVLSDEDKSASYVDIQGTLGERTKSYVGAIRKIITELKDNHEELGEQELDGQKVVGFVVRSSNEELKIWADPKTAHPIRMELSIGGLFVILKNFQLDPPIDDSLVSMEVPDGYTLDKTDISMGDSTEDDFIESLRVWAKVIGGGTFPDEIGTEHAMKQVSVLGQKMATMNLSTEEASQMGMAFGKGMLFHQILETGGQWNYAGQGVKLGDASKAVYWYKPQGSSTWRVIYGDLSVKDVAAENLPK
jgi:outer membrane lipoprotein-sorting protein